MVHNAHMKTCIKCLTDKPIGDFYINAKMADGHLNSCKSCCKSDLAKRVSENPEAFRAKSRERSRNRIRNADAQEHIKKWRSEDKRRMHCHNAVAWAIKKGSLIRQPCERCGGKANAHHESYDHPLIVKWLCGSHHKQRHIELALEGKTP